MRDGSSSAAKERAAHEIQACFNQGNGNEATWNIVCDCAWEAWNQPTEAAAIDAHRIHVDAVAADRLPDPAACPECGTPGAAYGTHVCMAGCVVSRPGPVSAAVPPAEPPELPANTPEARVEALEKALTKAIQVIEWCGLNDRTPTYEYNTPREFASWWPDRLREVLDA